ncbi:MAG TPA: hypothetical protein VHW24_13610 [Bryobacteraceae bacterium]|nr:hypothetical protein [Bryobacteraceae bacterium]
MASLTPRALFAPTLLLLSGASLISQQAPAPQRVPQFENSDVAVWRTTVMPHAPLAMHTHDHPRVIVALQGGQMKIVYADGGTEAQNWETGKAYWLPMEEGKRRHADANQGDKPIEVMVVELKNAK